ncbi:MAG: ABC transporter ATP-binding protein [Bacteroidales bacterium]|nr:ABC transporter ATP-binding protein [Bacteroidales bacterium]
MSQLSIQTSGLSKSFNGKKVVDSLSVEIKKGEVFGFLGPNGAGKTTSIKMITGLLKEDEGQVWINGQKPDLAISRQKVGLCPQDIIVWNQLTCKEQLLFIASMYGVKSRVARNRADVLLERLGLAAKSKSLARTLSGGMLRRLNLLMALMHDPEILILDEPEAGLDPQSRVLVRDFILSLSKTKTVIFTTHNMDEAERVCDRIAIIDSGHLLVTDTPETLKRTLGEGDVLEIRFAGNSPDLQGFNFLENAPLLKEQILYFRAFGIIEKMERILAECTRQQLSIQGLNLRENSLEDVFISLTGKTLRD